MSESVEKSNSKWKRRTVGFVGITILCFLAAMIGMHYYGIIVPANPTSAAARGDIDLLKKFEARGNSLDFQDPHSFNWTPLMAAIFFQQPKVIEYLLSKKIDVNIQDRNGRTALMWAIMTRDTNTVEKLFERSVDVGVKDSDGIDAIELAATSPDRDVLIKMFEEHGISATNKTLPQSLDVQKRFRSKESKSLHNLRR